MSKFELITDAFKGKDAEKTPISLWKHFPESDKTSEGLAKEEIAYQKRFDPDLKKISFNGLFPVIDYGIDIETYATDTGAARSTQTAIHNLEDWETLEPVDPNDGELGKQVKAVSLISKFTENTVPTMATVFSPSMVSAKLAGREQFLTHLRIDPDIVLSALKMLEGVVEEFAKACLDAGADGIFFATQQATSDLMTLAEFKKYASPYDHQVITAFSKKAEFCVTHIHGHNIHFAEVAHYPVQALNWHEQETDPTLAAAHELFKGGLLGGLDSNGVLKSGTPQEAAAQVTKSLQDAGNARSYVIIAPACVIPLDAPVENVDAIIRAVKNP